MPNTAYYPSEFGALHGHVENECLRTIHCSTLLIKCLEYLSDPTALKPLSIIVLLHQTPGRNKLNLLSSLSSPSFHLINIQIGMVWNKKGWNNNTKEFPAVGSWSLLLIGLHVDHKSFLIAQPNFTSLARRSTLFYHQEKISESGVHAATKGGTAARRVANVKLLDMSLACHMKLLVNLLSSQLPAALCIVPHNSALRNQSGPPFCCLLMRTWVDGAPTIDATIPIDARDVRATRRCRAATPSYVAWAQCVRRLL
eukprot:1138656-Pelagomonas_calceolata.AAC.4